MLINPSGQLLIAGACNTGCENALSIKYSYQVYKKMEQATVDEVWIPFLMPDSSSLGKFLYNYALENFWTKISYASFSLKLLY